MNRKEIRVPLSDIIAMPTFLTWESKNAWLADHNVEVEPDWAERESVDLATAWRMKDLYDEGVAQYAKEEQQRREHDAAVNKAQLEADAIYRQTFEAVLEVRPGGTEATEAARHEVVKFVRKLPRDIANSVQMKAWTEIGRSADSTF
ncbi:MAG: hypothetical protein JWN80_1389 [Microbacteriaceae bacterium]|nr:hypothetical protein [Microbacteriaceae bacterium]